MVSIQLQDGVAAALAERAQQVGLSVEELLSLVAGYTTRWPAEQLSGGQLETLLRAESSLHPVAESPSGTFSREQLYQDHD